MLYSLAYACLLQVESLALSLRALVSSSVVSVRFLSKRIRRGTAQHGGASYVRCRTMTRGAVPGMKELLVDYSYLLVQGCKVSRSACLYVRLSANISRKPDVQTSVYLACGRVPLTTVQYVCAMRP